MAKLGSYSMHNKETARRNNLQADYDWLVTTSFMTKLDHVGNSSRVIFDKSSLQTFRWNKKLEVN